MADILLTTLNCRYHHAAFGLRYLMANMGELTNRTNLKEFTISQNTRQIVKSILNTKSQIIGFGVYIWNAREVLDVVRILKRVAPEIKIILGGPEITYETETQDLYRWCDHVVAGEGDFLFRELCHDILAGKTREKIVRGPLPNITDIQLPYALYTDEDIRSRTLYVEASRGCPYKCEYCLSSLDVSVRNFDTQKFLTAMDQLIQRGARQFKFVDRTFNLSPRISQSILQFFLDRIHLGLFLHFEMVPDRLPMELRELIKKFPKGALQFEVGIQTWSPEVAARISRRQDYQKISENLRFLRAETGVHIHADLIAGLPGEDIESFARGFDALARLSPHEIQVGILKRLKGTPIVRHDKEWLMVYSEAPPYQILKTKVMDYGSTLRVQRFADFWDSYGNSGQFLESMEYFGCENSKSLFFAFDEFCEYLETRFQNSHGIALDRQFEALHDFLINNRGLSKSDVRKTLSKDYLRGGKRSLPPFLKEKTDNKKSAKALKHNLRQQRFLEGVDGPNLN